MAPVDAAEPSEEPSAKRLKRARAHPQGILPLGQRLIDGRANLREGLGPRLGALGDELLLQILGCASAAELAALARVCRALHVLASSNELWKAHVLEAVGGRFTYATSWKQTYVVAALGRPDARVRTRGREWADGERAFYSDILFRPWHCATLPLPDSWVRAGAGSTNLARLDPSTLTPAHFAARYDEPGTPCVLAGLAARWPATRGRWSREALLARFGERRFAVGEEPMRLADYYAYADAAADDPPLILFDPHAFSERAAPELVTDYESAPPPFGADHFALLGAARPHWRWLIGGHARSGSTWHVDPNRTSAWNACVSGRKKWLLTPPGKTPAGVSASADGATVRSPISVVEWYSNFLAQARRELGAALHEATVGPGDVLFVPRGWWHCVLNLDDNTLAVTQNFVTDANLAEVLEYAKPDSAHPERAEELLSGVPREQRAGLHGRLVEALRTHRPASLAAATTPEAVAAARVALGASGGGERGSAPPPSLWSRLTVHGTTAAAACGASDAALSAARGEDAPCGHAHRELAAVPQCEQDPHSFSFNF